MATPVQQCRSCGRGILWLLYEKTGKKAPIDAVPSAGGSILVDEERGTYTIISTVTERDELIGRLHKPHFETCPHAGEHRRR